MRNLLIISAILCSAAGSALAGPKAIRVTTEPVSSQSSRTLYVCDDSAATRRAFQREFGSIEFVTAEEVRSASGAWSTPKCITQSEARRLNLKLSAR